MKKSLIALTLAALPVAAMADVTLYGQVKAGVEISQIKVGKGVPSALKKYSENSNIKTPKSTTATEIADFGSRIGFKGHEHLADNLNAIWQIEQSTSVAGNKSGWGTRESFIGLEGGFGKVRAGNLNTTVKDSDAIDPWEYSNNALGLGVFNRDTVSDRQVSVRYDSPVFAGLSGSVQYSPRDNQNSADKYTHKEASKDAYYAGLNYENSGFFGQYAGGFRKNSVNTETSHKDGQVHRLTAGYDANNLFVAVAGQYGKNWETVGEYNLAAANVAAVKGFDKEKFLKDNPRGVETKEAAVTAAYRLGNVTPRVSYAHGWDVKAEGEKVKDSAYDQVIVGADYDFSKRTSALISAGWLRSSKGDTKIEHTAGLVGLRHKF